jgi:hypothetical protein
LRKVAWFLGSFGKKEKQQTERNMDPKDSVSALKLDLGAVLQLPRHDRIKDVEVWESSPPVDAFKALLRCKSDGALQTVAGAVPVMLGIKMSLASAVPSPPDLELRPNSFGFHGNVHAPMCFVSSCFNDKSMMWCPKWSHVFDSVFEVALARVAFSDKVLVSNFGDVCAESMTVLHVCTRTEFGALAMGEHSIIFRNTRGHVVGKMHVIDGFEEVPRGTDEPSCVMSNFAAWSMPHVLNLCFWASKSLQHRFHDRPAFIARPRPHTDADADLEWWRAFDNNDVSPGIFKQWAYKGIGIRHCARNPVTIDCNGSLQLGANPSWMTYEKVCNGPWYS